MASKGKVVKTVYNVEEAVYRSHVSRGLVDDAEPWHAYGELTSGGALVHHIVQPISLGGSLNIIDPAGVQMTLISTSADDDGSPAGTGVQTVHLHYLDANLDEQEETVILNGITGVTTTATDIRFITCMHIGDVGSGGKAAGDITASNGGTDYSIIATGEVRCTSSVRRVPRGKRLVITDVWAGSNSGSGNIQATIRFGTTYLDGTHDYTEQGIIVPQMAVALQNTAQALALSTPLVVSSGTIVAMETSVGGSGCTVVAGYVGILENA